MAIRAFIKGMGIGAGLMYLWDPDGGRRRRARIVDQWEHAVHGTQDFFDKAQRDASNRICGLTAQAGSLLHGSAADDEVITARVRSKLGRYSSHPHAICVDTHGGHVILSGPTLEEEVGDLLKAVCSVPGVRGVENRLEVHDQRGNFSALQGGAAPIGERPLDFLTDNWSPSTRAAGQLTGIALMANCLASRSLSSHLMGALGFGLFMRASTNRALGQLLGMQHHPQAVRFQRTVTIHAPVDKVWSFLSDFEEVGRFLPIVKSVRHVGDGHYRWAMGLPGGQTLEMEERVLESVPQQRLSWESVSDHPVSYFGTISLQRESENSTRVNVRFDYTPPGGVIGAALASLFGVDAKSQFQEAVMRIKPFLETGRPPRDIHDVSSGNRLNEMAQGQSKAASAGQSQRSEQEQLDRLSQMGQFSQDTSSQPSQRSAAGQDASDRLSQMGQSQWEQGQSNAMAESHIGSDRPGPIPPVQIPPVHAEIQPSPSPDHPERGRLG